MPIYSCVEYIFIVKYLYLLNDYIKILNYIYIFSKEDNIKFYLLFKKIIF